MANPYGELSEANNRANGILVPIFYYVDPTADDGTEIDVGDDWDPAEIEEKEFSVWMDVAPIETSKETGTTTVDAYMSGVNPRIPVTGNRMVISGKKFTITDTVEYITLGQITDWKIVGELIRA